MPEVSLGWWQRRLIERGVDVDAPVSRDGEDVLSLRDPDGMALDLVAAPGDTRSGWDGVASIPSEHAVRGLHAITLSERLLEPSAQMLTDLLGMHLGGEDGDRARFTMAGGVSGALVDVTAGGSDRGLQAGGTVHHVAFRAPDLATMTRWQGELHEAGASPRSATGSTSRASTSASPAACCSRSPPTRPASTSTSRCSSSAAP